VTYYFRARKFILYNSPANFKFKSTAINNCVPLTQTTPLIESPTYSPWLSCLILLQSSPSLPMLLLLYFHYLIVTYPSLFHMRTLVLLKKAHINLVIMFIGLYNQHVVVSFILHFAIEAPENLKKIMWFFEESLLILESLIFYSNFCIV